jgi:uncharacterized membrane protein
VKTDSLQPRRSSLRRGTVPFASGLGWSSSSVGVLLAFQGEPWAAVALFGIGLLSTGLKFWLVYRQQQEFDKTACQLAEAQLPPGGTVSLEFGPMIVRIEGPVVQETGTPPEMMASTPPVADTTLETFVSSLTAELDVQR